MEMSWCTETHCRDPVVINKCIVRRRALIYIMLSTSLSSSPIDAFPKSVHFIIATLQQLTRVMDKPKRNLCLIYLCQTYSNLFHSCFPPYTSGSIWTAFTEFGLTPDLLTISCFSFFFCISCFWYID